MMQETHQPGSSAGQPSALLRCLSQLNTDTWAQVMLPKLIEQGSAAAVALTCSQLRDLCYSSRQSIDLGTLLDDTEPSDLRSLVRNLPMHFPECFSVSVELRSIQGFHTMPYLLPTLARLSRLDGLSIKLDCEMPPVLAAALLYSTHAQLPTLRGLNFSVSRFHEWGWMIAEDVHRELGRASQLTCLSVHFEHLQVACLHSYAAVHHLSSLTQLQHLSIGGEWYNNSRYRNNSSILWPVLPPQLLPAMPGLTSLESNLFSVGTLTGLSCCANLQHLKVCLNADSTKLGPDDWAGLAGLTALTQLCLLNVELRDAIPEACTALSKLTRLQIAAAFKWSQAFLPALTACVQLTEVFGRWQWLDSSERAAVTRLDSSERAAVTLPRLLVLNTPGVTEGPPARYECFPNLRCLRQDVEVDSTPCLPDTAMHPSDLWSLCQHCTSLRELLLPADYYSLEPETNELRYSP